MKTKVSVLAATGTVGQKFVKMLENDPLFEITELAASEKSTGKAYKDIVQWRESGEIPTNIENLVLKNPLEFENKFIISSLPADVAMELEPKLAQKGHFIISNASAMRMNKTVPLIIPEVNPSHLSLLSKQETEGKIITNPNCSTVFLCMALAPLLNLGKIRHISVVTLQALSGAGHPGVSSNDILGNIIPYIGGEEEKIESEAKKILGEAQEERNLPITCHVHRVPVLHGHSLAIHIEFENEVNCLEVEKQYSQWNERAPHTFKVHSKADRPQPLRDITEFDQRCHIGRIKQGANKNIIGLVSQGHNLVRGAAGAALLNLKLLHNFLEN
jgi:aspartate-semialdehyde dehydrogenase